MVTCLVTDLRDLIVICKCPFSRLQFLCRCVVETPMSSPSSFHCRRYVCDTQTSNLRRSPSRTKGRCNLPSPTPSKRLLVHLLSGTHSRSVFSVMTSVYSGSTRYPVRVLRYTVTRRLVTKSLEHVVFLSPRKCQIPDRVEGLPYDPLSKQLF